ncbi:MAG: putative Na+/H+ antiporter [Pseudorhodoplanes sp.]|jgi:hypothetical protein|nr:putative Na+/H+ antiporter [Pseudorhodoplanes sp.]
MVSQISAPDTVAIASAIIFAVAIIHTFATRAFERLAHLDTAHAGFWRLMAEVEVVFGFWAAILILFMASHVGTREALQYLESRNFTEPAFVFAIMVIAASRPVIDFAALLLSFISSTLPIARPMAYYVTLLSVGPLLGSFITEPAAMTLTALLLRNRYFGANAPQKFMYVTIGVLFVNVSIGGTLTPYAAPPVLMVAERWGFDLAFMLQTFGWKAAVAVVVNATGATFLFRSYLNELPGLPPSLGKLETPIWIVAVHLAFLAAIVIFNHHLVVFLALFLFFLGFAHAYKQYQSSLILREGLLVGFFLAGLVVLGGQQKWWLQPLLSDMGPTALFTGATLLTAITDNAALTYLGSLVEGVSDEFKYSLVAGAVTGGGLTVIANAPNPAGFAILKGSFKNGVISPAGLFAGAAVPTLVAAAAFMLLP